MPQLISPHLDPRLRDYIESVQRWCRAGPPTRERIDELVDLDLDGLGHVPIVSRCERFAAMSRCQ